MSLFIQPRPQLSAGQIRAINRQNNQNALAAQGLTGDALTQALNAKMAVFDANVAAAAPAGTNAEASVSSISPVSAIPGISDTTVYLLGAAALALLFLGFK